MKRFLFWAAVTTLALAVVLTSIWEGQESPGVLSLDSATGSAQQGKELSNSKGLPSRVRLDRPDSAKVVQHGGLWGRIVSASQAPVGGARVAVGRLDRPRSGLRKQTLDGKWVGESGSDGKYEIKNVEGGVWDVEITANHYSTLVLRVQVTNTAQERDFFLQRAAKLSGTVTNEDGSPAKGALVVGGPREPHDLELRTPPNSGPQHWPMTRTDDRGWFELAAIEPGAVYVVAGVWSADSDGPLALSRAAFSLAPDEQASWNPTLASTSRRLRVSFVNNDGGSSVRIRRVYALCNEAAGTEAPPPRLSHLYPAGGLSGTKDTVWTTVHSRLEPHTIVGELMTQDNKVEHVRKESVVPSDDVVIIHVDQPQLVNVEQVGRIVGRISDAGGYLAGRVLGVELLSRGRSLACRVEDSTFSCDKVPTGKWRVSITADGAPVINGNWFNVEHNQIHDLGTYATVVPGTVEVTVTDQGGGETGLIENGSLQNDSYYYYPLALNAEGRYCATNVTPGEYRAVLSGTTCLATGTVRVLGGDVAKVFVHNVRAIRQTIRIWLPQPETWGRCEVRTQVHQRELASEHDVLSSEIGWRPLEWDEMLPLGQHSIDILVDGVHKRTLRFTCELSTAHLPQTHALR